MYRLIYKSCSNSEIDLALIDSLLISSEKNNPDLNVTGVLLATRTHFLQVLEGSFESVNELYYTISRDSRHHTLQLVSFTCVEDRVFPDWSMHGIGIFSFNSELETQLKSAFGEEGGEVRLPVTEWQTLAMIEQIRQAHIV